MTGNDRSSLVDPQTKLRFLIWDSEMAQKCVLVSQVRRTLNQVTNHFAAPTVFLELGLV